MEAYFKRLFRQFFLIGFLVLASTALLAFLIVPSHLIEIVVAYLLSFTFVGSNFTVLKNIKKESHNTFYKRFFTTMGLRLFFVLATIVAVLTMTGFHQIYFTVSFIFSYILHSVIEIMTIEKLLQKDK